MKTVPLKEHKQKWNHDVPEKKTTPSTVKRLMSTLIIVNVCRHEETVLTNFSTTETSLLAAAIYYGNHHFFRVKKRAFGFAWTLTNHKETLC